MPVEETIRPGRYRHFKGNCYEVLCTATHSETLVEKRPIGNRLLEA